MATPGVDGEVLDADFLSFNSFRFTYLGFDVSTLKEFAHKASQEGSPVYGSANDPIGFTSGKRAYELSFTCRTDEFDRMSVKAQAAYGKPIRSIRGNAIISYGGANGTPRHTIEARVHKIASTEEGASDGADATEVKVTCNVLFIKKDGLALFEDSIYDD